MLVHGYARVRPNAGHGHVRVAHHAAVRVGPAAERVLARHVAVAVLLFHFVAADILAVNRVGLALGILVRIDGKRFSLRNIAGPAVGHRVLNRFTKDRRYLEVNRPVLPVTTHLIGKSSGFIQRINARGEAECTGIQGNPVGHGVGFASIRLRSGLGLGDVPSEALRINTHTRQGRYAAVQFNEVAHGVSHNTGIGGRRDFPSDALEEVRQFIHIVCCLEMIVAGRNSLHGINCVGIISAAQINAVNFAASVFGIACFDNGGLTVIFIVKIIYGTRLVVLTSGS